MAICRPAWVTGQAGVQRRRYRPTAATTEWHAEESVLHSAKALSPALHANNHKCHNNNISYWHKYKLQQKKFQQGPMWGHAVLYVVMCPWRHVFVLRTNSYVLALILGFKVLGLVLEKKSSAIIPRTDAHWAELILPQHWADVTACPPRR